MIENTTPVDLVQFRRLRGAPAWLSEKISKWNKKNTDMWHALATPAIPGMYPTTLCGDVGLATSVDAVAYQRINTRHVCHDCKAMLDGRVQASKPRKEGQDGDRDS